MLTLINGASPTLLSDVGRIRPCVPVAVPFLEAARMPVQHEKSAIPLNFAAQFAAQRSAIERRGQSLANICRLQATATARTGAR
jgi:hypothetical protein